MADNKATATATHNVLVETFDKSANNWEGAWTEFLMYNANEVCVRATFAHAATKNIDDVRITVVNTTAPSTEADDYTDVAELRSFFDANW